MKPIDYSPTLNRALSWAGIGLFVVLMIVAWTSETEAREAEVVRRSLGLK